MRVIIDQRYFWSEIPATISFIGNNSEVIGKAVLFLLEKVSLASSSSKNVPENLDSDPEVEMNGNSAGKKS